VNTTETHLLDVVRAFCFPGGEAAARRVNRVRIAERGEMASAPKARRIPFTAHLEIDTRRSRFRWEARFCGGLGFFTVTDAYEGGRGLLSVRAGILPLKKMAGPEFNRGELQRYLASFALCPAMLLNHPGLVWSPAGDRMLRVSDGDVNIELEFEAGGCPVGFRAERPRVIGNRAVPTLWSGRTGDFREWDGIRVPVRTEAYWHLPEGLFRYFHSEITAVTALN
jgi:hypothetical protein